MSANPSDMTAEERAIVAARRFALAAAENNSKTCIFGEAMFFMAHSRALIPGHIYTELGMQEVKISGCCEYHFDKMYEPGWKDPVTGELGDTPEEPD